MTTQDHLKALLDAGYEITLQSGGSAGTDEYYAHIQLGGGPLLTGTGTTPELALWTASPLHTDDEPIPANGDLKPGDPIPLERTGGMAGFVVGECGHRVAGSEWRVGFRNCERCGAWPDDPEDAPAIDSHLWYCARCGGQCIGHEPANSVCRGCGGI